MTFEEPVPVESLEPPPSHPRPPVPSLLKPAAILAAGVLVIGLLALVEGAVQPRGAWSDALLVMSEEPPEEGAPPVLLRKVPGENFTQNPILREMRAMPEGLQALREIGLDEPKRESVSMLSLRPEEWDGLLASGRLPEAGTPEVLAGELTRLDSFVMDGQTFRVVGRIRREISPFIFGYILPESPDMRSMFEADDVEKGWVVSGKVIEEMGRAVAMDPKWENVKIYGGFSRIPGYLTVGAVIGLALTTLGGALLLAGLFRRLEPHAPLFLRPVLAEVSLRPGLYWGLHVISYGAWFACMLLALVFPLANLLLVQIVQNVFVSGELEHVGRAYASGNIPAAALATFQQNFFVATFLSGILPSLIIPFWEVFKNMLSFTVLGFAMSPIWADRISGYTYHSITVVMELEAYILAGFIIAAWPIRVLEGLLSGEPGQNVRRGLAVVASGTLIVALILFAAALYEAATLILIGG